MTVIRLLLSDLAGHLPPFDLQLTDSTAHLATSCSPNPPPPAGNNTTALDPRPGGPPHPSIRHHTSPAGQPLCHPVDCPTKWTGIDQETGTHTTGPWGEAAGPT